MAEASPSCNTAGHGLRHFSCGDSALKEDGEAPFITRGIGCTHDAVVGWLPAAVWLLEVRALFLQAKQAALPHFKRTVCKLCSDDTPVAASISLTCLQYIQSEVDSLIQFP